VVLAALAAGCAGAPTVAARPEYRTERARSAILVAPGSRDTDAVPVTRAVAGLLARELGARFFNVLDLDAVAQASPDLAIPVARVAGQVMAGQLIDRDVAEVLFQRHGVGQLLVLDVFRYEQYWGRETKITRVGLDARLILLADGRILWHGRVDPEVSGFPGHALDAATHRVVRELVRTMAGGLPDIRDTPLAEWPVLEYLTPN
jgi:hypothetical protein